MRRKLKYKTYDRNYILAIFLNINENCNYIKIKMIKY